MGVVWRARDTHLNRDVALKLLPDDAADQPGGRSRFLHEARAASALIHPNIVTIHDVSADRGIDFIAMELVAGGSLRDRMRARRLAREEVAAFGKQIADALGKAHQSGLVHRDVKPSNVMIGDDEVAKVVDFGLAKAVPAATGGGGEVDTETRTATAPHTAVGTAAYMSPEQVVGSTIDARSDVFSFGALLFEMLTGRKAFGDGPRAEIMLRVLETDPAAALPDGDLETIARRCLSRSRDARYANGAEVAAALRALPAGSSGRGRAGRSWLWAAGLGALIAVAVLALVMPRGATSAAPQRGLVVLPFTSIGASEQGQAFGLGLTLAATTYLSEADGFQRAFWVVPAADVLQTRPQSVRDARQLFNVDLVINGSVETGDGRVRVTAVVSDAATRRQLRSRQVTRDSGDALALQDELLRVIAELLEVEVPVAARSAIRGSASTEPEAQDFYLQGRGYLQAGDRADAAIEVFRRALSRDAGFAAAHAGLAEACLQKFAATKDPVWIDQAAAAAAEALRLNGNLPEALMAAGMVARAGGRYEDAVERLLKAVEQTPRGREAWLQLAQAYESARRLPEAEDAYRKAIAVAQSNPRSHQALGAYLYRQGRYAEAETAFGRATALAPDNHIAFQQLGTVYLQMNRYDDARRLLQRSLDIRPNSTALNNLGASYFYEKRYAEAVPVLEQAVELGPVTPAHLGNLARMYRLTPALASRAPAMYQRAFALADTLLQVNPRDADTLADVAWLRAETGDRAAALKALNAAVAVAPGSAAVLFRAVLVHELTGDRAKAIEAYRSLAATGTLLEEIRRRPELEALQSDPRFKEATWPRNTPSTSK